MGVIIRNGIEYSGAGMGGGSCDCDIVYLTQEEYDALPASKESNNVEYRITNANTSATAARNIGYDNSESGIAATSVQGAIDAMNESLAWKHWGSFAGKNQITLPSTWNEICVTCMPVKNTGVRYIQTFPKGSYPNGAAVYIGRDENNHAQYAISSTYIILQKALYGGTTDTGNEATTDIMYR